MNLTKVFLILIISIKAHAFILIDPYLGVGIGDYSAHGEGYNHDGHMFSAEGGARLGLTYLGLQAGFVGSYSKTHTQAVRSVPGPSSYDFVARQNLIGGFVGFDFPVLPVRIFAEYYQDAEAKFTFAENKFSNIFEHNDILDGHGYSVGVGFSPFIIGAFNLQYRKLTYKKLSRNGEETNLPSSEFSKVIFQQVLLSFSLNLDIL